ncbi:MAG: DUF1802 family protein, partial [Planctomycetia bacterium]
MNLCKIAFKEWAVVAAALADGRQSLIVRKGGIHERGGVFTVEYDRFWLYPTQFHQDAGKLTPAAADLAAALRTVAPPVGRAPMKNFAVVDRVWRVD